MDSNTQSIGIATMVPMGNWSATTPYKKLNTVRYNGATYIAKKQNTGFQPTVTQGWQEVWQVLCYDGGSVSPDGNYPNMTVGKATNDSDGNNIAETYVKLSDLDRLILERDYPPGGEKPYVQFPGMPEPSQRWSGTVWEPDTSMAGRVLIGSGTSDWGTTYTHGAMGGEATHTLTVDELAQHTHTITGGGNQLSLITGDAGNYRLEFYTDGGAVQFTASATGASKPFNIMQPHTVATYWKRIA